MSSIVARVENMRTISALAALLAFVVGCGGGGDSNVDVQLAALKPDTYETILAASKCEALLERHDDSADIVRKNLELLPKVGPAILPLLLGNLALRLAEVNATEARTEELACEGSPDQQSSELKRATCEALDVRHQQAADSFNEAVVDAVAETRDELGC